MKKLHKKGQVFEGMKALGIGIAALTITLVVTFLILSQGKEQITEIQSGTVANMGPENGTSAYNATVTLEGAVEDIPGWVPLIVIAVIGSILLGLVALFKRR